jgi:hypothetical protein
LRSPPPAEFVKNPNPNAGTSAETPSTSGVINNLKYIMCITDGDASKDQNKYDTFTLEVIHDESKNVSCKLTKIEGKSQFNFTIGPYSSLETLGIEVGDQIKNGSFFKNVDPKPVSSTTYRFYNDEDLAYTITDFIRYCDRL